ncbi:cellulose biosynthesis cyclic di-GMP-binding regulatory protein BcsB [Aliivibrio sp. S3MY1]|uniref:cellulose biosynthesis cyclic di-GMP-binding regulatory protein BcsB n=1 Tax=unclassified Aliivibrio TaxID=2645654 RepID=UPI0023790FD1|nr:MULTISPECIES: cellulose biosynthesis cyclic di-GMP-binding regulatory protein BcsB [unclassified Aliivibrio]MDD9195101.1 cellulose biosynthesis cyclic di-GMP-binding regulatory protein BcsB [Aliivibrio sp. S3MY1]MDD9198391.1 cellulose biosynthesis cyclic di-GMP-binding regulatory protein BcsB [Aliivibrio sp. S2MY1]
MWMKTKINAIAMAIGLISFTASAVTPLMANKSNNSTQVTSGEMVTSHVSPIVTKNTFSFSDLGYGHSIQLQGSESTAYVGFGSRLDEVVSQASLRFDLIPSPALLSLVSHIKVYFNNELVGVVTIDDGMQGKSSSVELNLDPRLFTDYNQLKFELVGNVSMSCSNPNASSIWAEISSKSTITLLTQKTKINNDLSLLPAPFFDSRDMGDLTLPMVFSDKLDINEIKAAGIASSYFGSLSEWRGSDFPMIDNALPTRNAIVFITNDSKPDFLRNFPDVDGPRIQMISHPTDPYVKLLLVIGRDTKDLVTAAKGLALGKNLFTGPSAKINKAEQLVPRKPYDAPNWIDTDRAVALSDLLPESALLQVEGQTPPPISVHFRLPPDLFTWQSRGIPFDLNYRYTPPLMDNSGSRMTLSVNNQFVKAFNLNTSGESTDNTRIRLPLLDDDLLGGGDVVRIPAFQVGSKNEVKFEFGFASSVGGKEQCQTTQPSKNYAVIGEDSTIDFSGFLHYIEMPNMRAFANSGYPFTRMADLSDTVVVIPQHASNEEIQTFVNMMGVFGSNSGYPVLNVTVTDNWNKETLENKDILTIGVMPELASVDKKDIEHIQLISSERVLNLPSKNESQRGKNWVDPASDNQQVADSISIHTTGNFAAITSVESPYTAQRTMVSLLAQTPESFALINQALNDSGKISSMFGSVITLRDDEVASFNVGERYYVGELPISQLIWYHFSKYPLLIAFFATLLVVMVTIILYRVLRHIAQRRLSTEEDEL